MSNRERTIWSNREETNAKRGVVYYLQLDPRSVQLTRELKDMLGGDGLGAVSVSLIVRRSLAVYREYLDKARLDTAEGQLRERQRIQEAKEGK